MDTWRTAGSVARPIRTMRLTSTAMAGPSGDPRLSPMNWRTLVTQCVVAGMAAGMLLAGFLLLAGYQRDALGLLFGTAVGVVNQIMLAVRVAGIGNYGSIKQTQRVIVASAGMRFAMIGLATVIVIKLPGVFGPLGFMAGLLLTMAVGTVLGARWFLRGG